MLGFLFCGILGLIGSIKIKDSEDGLNYLDFPAKTRKQIRRGSLILIAIAVVGLVIYFRAPA